ITRAYPNEALRLLGIAKVAWSKVGVEHPEEHIAVLHSWVPPNLYPLANVIVKRSAFTAQDIARLNRIAADIGFGVAYEPAGGENEEFKAFASAADPYEYARNYPIDISPTTDDSPFFFNRVRIRDILFGNPDKRFESIADKATSALLRLLALVTVLAATFVIGPLFFRRRLPVSARRGAPFLFYFSCLGLAFILVELPMIQRFMLFLGHPLYALSVILFTILIFSGLGSLSTQRVPAGREGQALRRTFPLLVVVLLASIVFLPPLFRTFVGEPTPIKVVASMILLAPLGFLMGQPFPLGLRILHRRATELTPWAWGVNGAASVLASVGSIVLAIGFGYSIALATGLAFYALAWTTSIVSGNFVDSAE
ncbi:MAG: hypothetical protein Q8R92_03140, partial [Deltaproteobacteria bacterium]|nr:hypothetical protein [Deltaproteobacteria bacterium]